MIKTNGKDIIGLFYSKSVIAVYKGANLVWQSIRSCFGTGVWVGNKPWIGSDKWKDHR